MPRFFVASETTEGKFKDGDICHYEILRKEVEYLKFGRISQFLNQLKSYRSIPRQRVIFTFAGYDNDSRELLNIPAVIHYTKELLKRHWYFWYYAIPNASYFFVIAFLFNENNYTILNDDTSRKVIVESDVAGIEDLVIEIKEALQSFGTHIDDEIGAHESYRAWIAFITSYTTAL